MARFSTEAKVGVFVVVGIILLGYMSLRLGKFEIGRARGYDLYAYFDSVAGLVKNASVEIAGVEVGRVKDISLEEGKAKVTLLIRQGIRLGSDLVASIRTKGVLGDKYVELTMGSPYAPPLKPGGRIVRTISPADIDTLFHKLSAIGDDIKSITGSILNIIGGKEGQESLRMIIKNMREMSDALNKTVQANNENMNQLISNLTDFSKDLKEVTSSNKGAIAKIITNLRRSSARLDETLVALKGILDKINKGEGTIGKLLVEDDTAKNLEAVLVSLKEVSDKINKGEGTIGKLINEEETVDNINTTLTSINEYLQKDERFRTYLNYRGEYLFDSEEVKSYLSLRIQPREDKYYLLQVVDDPAGRTTETEITTTKGGVISSEYKKETDKDAIKFSAQIAKRYYDLGLRGGIFESTGGAAIDYYLFQDHLVLSLEAFDFDSDRNAHLKFKADLTPFQYLYVTAGFDDFISTDGRESFFFGAGIHFSDEDIKTLLSNVPIPGN
nr:MCE family protein [Desulfobacterales bacterium]